MHSKSIKRHDTGPPVLGKLVNKSGGQAVDLTSVTITFIMNDVDGNELVNSAATITDATAGEFQYNWAVGDTETVGTHLAAFQLIFTADSNRKETFPASGWINIEIQPDLDDA
jgi:hypothetical protein